MAEQIDGQNVPGPLPYPPSPDIVKGPPLPSCHEYKISQIYCEPAVFIWELQDTFPLPLIPPQEIINPQEPEQDSSTSIIDLMERIPSGRFIRGQEINKPTEWQLYLQNSQHSKATEKELQLALHCEKIFIQASARILAKVACEIIDEEGVAIWSSGDVYDSEVKAFSQGTSHAISLGKKTDLQQKRTEIVKNGFLRFRLRLNIYKELSPGSVSGNNENETPLAKRRRLESGMECGLTDLLGSLESMWNSRQQSGDITILCNGQEIKAHRFILSGRSKVFMEMLDSKMETKEKSTCVININDISAEIFLSVLEFLYLSRTSRFDWWNIDHICALIYAADKYWIKPLMTRCYQNLMKMMTLENFGKIAKVTFMYDCDKQFKDEVRHFFESNQVTLNEVASFRAFAYDDFEYFHKLFFYIP